MNCEKCNKKFKDKSAVIFHLQHCDPIAHSKFLNSEKVCERCNKKFIVKDIDNPMKTGRFCSKFCAHSFSSLQRKFDTNERRAKSVSDFWKNSNKKPGKIPKIVELKICPVCSIEFRKKTKLFCSLKCKSRAGGLISAQKRINRSKNEILFYELCKQNFENVLHNESIFNGWDADVILPDLKIAILWNGPWHYRQLNKKHSVKQVQNRDIIKITEIQKTGYIPYIIKDDGKYNSEFVEKEFQKFLIKHSGMEKWMSHQSHKLEEPNKS